MLESSYKKNPYILPPINLLDGDASSILCPKQNSLEKLLELYGVYVNITGVFKGYSVTRYELTPKPGTRLSEIYDMKDDLECQLATGHIRIEKATPDNPIIGIEIPNKEYKHYHIKELIESKEFKSANKTSIAIGIDNKESPVTADLDKLPHWLISGSTGSGKSMFIRSLIVSLLYKSSPEDVQLILVDIMGIESDIFDGILHFPIKPITHPKAASEMLKWAVKEIDRRYRLFKEIHVRDIENYNRHVMSDSQDRIKLPHIVLIIDELADLMINQNDDVEASICKIAQLSRSAGIHLIIATQMPSCNILTGIIKANISNRIAFALSSAEDSKSFLNQEGAECLLGSGDMLFYPHNATKPLRIQGAYVSEDAVKNVAEYLRDMAQRTSFKNPLSEDKDLILLGAQ